MKRILSYSCFLGIASSMLTILISIYYNPWFDFFKNAFSGLGSDEANMPWIYNYGLIITSIFVYLYSVYLAMESKNKLEVFASAFFFIAGIFLALIGIYHAGTRPHVFVSSYFFFQSWLSIFTWSMGIMKRKFKLGLSSLILAIIAPLLAYFIKWPSVASLEALGIAVIYFWVLISFFSYSKI